MDEPQRREGAVTDRQRAQELVKQAWQQAESGCLREALALVDHALTLRPASPVYITVKGAFLRDAGDLDTSERTLRAAIEINDRNHFAWTELGNTYNTNGCRERAAFCYEQAARLYPATDTYTMLAAMQLALEQRAAAIENASRALAMEPDWEEAQNILARARRIQ